jgi:hypothetical protein
MKSPIETSTSVQIRADGFSVPEGACEEMEGVCEEMADISISLVSTNYK